MLKLNIQLFAHKKGVGSTKNGRDSESKRLGVKRADGLLSLDIQGDATAAQAILSGLRLHLQALHDQYPRRVQLSNTEV